MTAKSVGIVGGADGGTYGGTGGATGRDCCVWALVSVGGCWDVACCKIGLAVEARGAVEEEAVGLMTCLMGAWGQNFAQFDDDENGIQKNVLNPADRRFVLNDGRT